MSLKTPTSSSISEGSPSTERLGGDDLQRYACVIHLGLERRISST